MSHKQMRFQVTSKLLELKPSCLLEIITIFSALYLKFKYLLHNLMN